MTAIVYPPLLPGPQKWTIKGTDRRASSSLRQPGNSYRDRSRDKNEVASAEWMYDSTQMTIWKAWARDTLIQGQGWFAKITPGVTASVRVVRYLLSTMRRQNLGNGAYLITCDMEVRGLSVTPMTPHICFVERFESELTPYSVVTVGSVPFSTGDTPYGTGLITTISDTAYDNSAIARSIGPISARTFSAKFLISSIHTDDAGLVACYSGTDSKIAFNPRRETVFDSLSRPLVYVGGGSQFAASAALASGAWHQVDVTINPGAGNSTSVITLLSDNSIVSSVALTGDLTPLTVDHLRFTVDDADRLSETIYADVHICE